MRITEDVLRLAERIQVAKHQIRSRSLEPSDARALLQLESEPEECVVYALDQGETISAEILPGHKWITMLEGRLRVRVEEEDHLLSPGMTLVIAKQSWHELEALDSSKYIHIIT